MVPRFTYRELLFANFGSHLLHDPEPHNMDKHTAFSAPIKPGQTIEQVADELIRYMQEYGISEVPRQ